MNDDVRNYIYGALIIFLAGVLAWIAFLFVNACGFTLTCRRGAPLVDRTPIPTLLPATLPAMETGSGVVVVSDRCHIPAVDLIGAWVAAGSPETASFQFTDMNDQACESTFEEIKPLFVEGNFWYPGSLSCVSCHSVDVSISPAQLDLGSYDGILAGSRRQDINSKGTNILGDESWKDSLLYEFLSNDLADIPGHTTAVSDLIIFAGKPLPVQPSATPAPVPTAAP